MQKLMVTFCINDIKPLNLFSPQTSLFNYVMLNTNIMPDNAQFSRGACDSMQSSPCFYLIIVVVTMKERFLSKNHTGKHAAQTPHVQAVVIHLYTKEGKGNYLTNFMTAF